VAIHRGSLRNSHCLGDAVPYPLKYLGNHKNIQYKVYKPNNKDSFVWQFLLSPLQMVKLSNSGVLRLSVGLPRSQKKES